MHDLQLPPGLRYTPRADRVRMLRAAIDSGEPVVLPGVVSAVTALQAEQTGFKAGYLSGAGLSNFDYAVPDIGLTGLAEVAEQTRRITAATTLPIIVDADTGYGGPLSVLKTMRELQAAGAAGIQLEDQQIPKRCGHFAGKKLVDAAEMVAKIRAAVLGREDGTIIVARTDAASVEGLDAAIARAKAYSEAGADVIFVEAPRSTEELRRVAYTLRGVKLLANVVEGGLTPQLSVTDLHKLGFSIALFANAVTRVMLKASAEAFEILLRDGSSNGLNERMLDWDSRQRLVGLKLADAFEDALRVD
jgi:2-methylisocitrate lyase-like PEP mutase family enzyme